MAPQKLTTPATLRKTRKKTISIMQTFDKSLYDKACIVAKRKGLTVQQILRNLLSEAVSNEILQ